MAQPRSTPDDEAAMLLLRFFGQPVPDTTPGPSSPAVSQTLTSRQKTPPFDTQSDIPGPTVTSILSQSTSSMQVETPSIASLHKEQDDSFPRLSHMNDERPTPSMHHNLKRKRIASDLAETSESRLGPAVSGGSISIETATSAPKALPAHFMGPDNQSYRCICGTTIEPEAGYSIQCESCLAWQHAGCFGLGGNELEGTTYFCQLCSDETGKHQPDEPDNKDIRHLAENSVPVQLPLPEDTRQPTEEYAKEAKRSRFTGSSRGKGRVRQSVTLPKPIEADVPEAHPTAISTGPVTVAPPRTQRKKSVLSSRIPKGKPSSVSGPVTEEDPLVDEVQDETTLRELPSDHDITSRTLDYIPISDDLMPTACLGVQGSTSSHLLLSSIHTLKSKPTVQPPPRPSTNRPTVVVPITNSKPSVSNSDRTTQLTFIKVVLPDNSIRSSIGLSGIVAEEHEHTPTYIAPQYGVFARSELTSGQSIGQICGEIYSLATYVQEPANQYAVIGLPKPFVQRVSSPFDVVVDARRYGNDLRFIRSSCKANAVLVPSSKPGEESFTVEVNLTRAVRQGEEITLPWAWDEFHLVHELRGSPLIPRSHLQSDRLAHIGRHLARVFKSCACHDRSTCPMSMMSELVANLGSSTSQHTRDDTQLFCHAQSRGFGVSQTGHGWKRSSPDAASKDSFVQVEQPHDPLLLDLDPARPYNLDYNLYGYAALHEEDFDWSDSTSDESSIDDLTESSSRDAEGSWHQDLRLSLSKKFVNRGSTVPSGNIGSPSSQSDMDVADEIASVSETSTLTEPMWQDDREEDLLDLRTIGLRHRSASSSPGAIGLEATQLPDPTDLNNIREVKEFDRAYSATNTASSHLIATVVGTKIVPAAIEQDEEPCLSKLNAEGGLHPDSIPDGTLIADPEGPIHVDKPEIHAKKQRIDLTKFMQLGSPVERGATNSSTQSPSANSIGERVSRMDSTTVRPPSKSCAVVAVSTFATVTPWWKRSESEAGEERSFQAPASLAQPADPKTFDLRHVGD